MNMEPKENDQFLAAFGTAKGSDRKMQYPDANFFSRKRYLVSLWACVGYGLLFILRSNLSIAIVELTYKKNITLENGTVVEEAAEYDWNPAQKGFIISLFNYGYYLAPVCSILAIKYGGVTTYGYGIAITALLSTLSPYLLRLHFIYFAIARVLEGVFEAVSATAFLNIFLYWSPPNEQSRLVMLGFLGCLLGVFSNFSICGLIAQNLGVSAIFTVTGGLSLVWSVIGLLLISNSPLTDKLITTAEKNYFKNFISSSNEKKPIYPWREILTSKPAWALFNEYFCISWSSSFIMVCMPIYVKDVFNVNIKTIGYISSVPILGSVIGIFIGSCIADYVRSHKLLRIPTLHRIYLTTGQLACVVFLIIAGLWANVMESIICFSLSRFFVGFADVSYLVICMDMFGEYTALVRGIAQLFYNTGSLLNPTVMGFFASDHSRSSWNLYFLFLTCFNIFSLVIFYKYGSGEFQQWAAPQSEEDRNKEKDSQKGEE